MKLPWTICVDKCGSLQRSSTDYSKGKKIKFATKVPLKYLFKIKCPRKLFQKRPPTYTVKLGKFLIKKSIFL